MASLLLAAFFAGCLVGGLGGVFAMALVQVAKRADERAARFRDVDQLVAERQQRANLAGMRHS